LLSLVLLFSGETILLWVYGIEYQQAAMIMIVLAAGRCFAVFCGVPATTLAMTDHQNLVMKVMTTLSLLTLVGYFMVADQAGTFGVALVTAISIATQNLVMAYLVRRRLGILTWPTFSPDIWQKFVQQLSKRKRAN
jgi:O-antigen/teichoic acid export membrane protein